MKRASLIFLLVFLVAIPLSVSGQDGNTLVIRGFGNISTFNPALSNSGSDVQAFGPLFPKPFETDRFTGEPVPGLTTWEISDDGLVYTFHIQEDANWSDGTPITAQDMKFVIEAVQQEDVATTWESQVALIESVNVIDDKTYEVVMSQVNCAAMYDLGSIRFLPSHKYATDFSDFMDSPFNTNPDVSGGPYILESWAPDEGQRYRANANYWRGEPSIPFLVNRLIGEEAVAMQSIQAGEIDYSYFQGDSFAQIVDRSNLQWETFPRLSVNFLSLNWVDPNAPSSAYDENGNLIEQVPHPLFSDIRVRKAVAMGYNKQDILATLGGPEGGSQVIGAVAPQVAWAINTDIEPYPYDPDAAAALLEEAGWLMNEQTGIREKDGRPLAFTINYSDILLYFETTAFVIQDQLRDIGFDVTLNKQEWGNYITDTYLGQKYDATPMSNSGGSGGPPDPSEFMTLLDSRQDIVGSGNNIASYVNPELDTLIDQGRNLPGCDRDARAEIYREIQRIAHEDIAYDWTVNPNLFQTATRRVQGFRPGPSWVFYGYVDFLWEWSLGG